MGWAALSELVPYYPLYALLFLDTGLSAAQISVLFAIWSVTGFVTEVPAGALADRWSRRGVVVLAAVLQAVAFVVWTAAPGVLGLRRRLRDLGRGRRAGLRRERGADLRRARRGRRRGIATPGSTAG